MPNRTHLTSETAPPPVNPKLQLCIEQDLFAYYDENQDSLVQSIDLARSLDLSALPEDHRTSLKAGFESAALTFANVETVREKAAALTSFEQAYRPLHQNVRNIQRDIKKLNIQLEQQEDQLDRLKRRKDTPDGAITDIERTIDGLRAQLADVEATIPEEWEAQRERYLALAKEDKIARVKYRRGVDEAYEPLKNTRLLLTDLSSLKSLEIHLNGLDQVIEQQPAGQAMDAIKGN